MATTSNGIRYPSGSDTVNIATDAQNLASDIETAIASQTFNITTAGDLLGYTGSVHQRLAIEPRPGFVLQADSTQATGMKWSNEHYPNMFFIASVSTTTGSQPILSFTAIPQIFSAIKLYVFCQVNTSTEDVNLISINGLGTATNASQWNFQWHSLSGDSAITFTESAGVNTPTLTIAGAGSNLVSWSELTISEYANQTRTPKPITIRNVQMPASATANNFVAYRTGQAYLDSTTLSHEITSLSLQWSSTNSAVRWAAYLYGVK
jgi:hypothetical protein